jgi:hypothetical protein
VRHAGGNRVEIGGRVLEIGEGEFAGPGNPMSFCVKTHDMELLPDAAQGAHNVISGVVRSQAYLGNQRDYIVGILDAAPEGTPGQEVLVAAPPAFDVPPGSRVQVRFRSERCRGLVR